MKKLLIGILLIACTASIQEVSAQQVQKYSAQQIEATKTLKLKGVTLTSLNAIAPTVKTQAFAASSAIDFSAQKFQTITLTGNLTLTSSNLGAAREVYLRIVADGTQRTLTFPATWKFLDAAAPANIAASKTGLLILRSYGTTDSNVLAIWHVEP